MEEYSGLSKIRNNSTGGVYCPDCKNYLEVVGNGFFHGELFYCPKEKKVFAIYLRDITKKSGEAFLKQCESDVDLWETRKNVNKENLEEVKKIIKCSN